MTVETKGELYKVGRWIGAEVPSERIPCFITDLAEVIGNRENQLHPFDDRFSVADYREVIKLGLVYKNIVQSAIGMVRSEGSGSDAAIKVLDFEAYFGILEGINRLSEDSRIQFDPEIVMQAGIKQARDLARKVRPDEAAGFQMRVTYLVINDVLGLRRDG